MAKTNWILFLILITGFCKSQTNSSEHISGFNMASITYKQDKHWLFYIESQARQIEDYSKIDYYEIKGGIGYNINKNHQPFIGVGKYGTYKSDKLYQNEIRLWLQYIYSHNINRLKLDHRVRLEKRFFDFPQTDTQIEDSRARYRLTLTLPINNKKTVPGTFFVNAFDEIFFAPKEPNFKRHRVFGGFGYVFNDYLNVNMGYLWQREFAFTGNRNLHFMYFGLNFVFDRLKHFEYQKIQVAD